FEPLGVVGREDGGAQLVAELALVFDALEDGLLAVGELAEQGHALLDGAEEVLVESAGALLAVAGDEGNGVAFIEELDDALHLDFADLEVLGDPREVEVAKAPWRHRRSLHVVSIPARPAGRAAAARGSRRRPFS